MDTARRKRFLERVMGAIPAEARLDESVVAVV
jgi:hypothetical protein